MGRPPLSEVKVPLTVRFEDSQLINCLFSADTRHRHAPANEGHALENESCTAEGKTYVGTEAGIEEGQSSRERPNHFTPKIEGDVGMQ